MRDFEWQQVSRKQARTNRGGQAHVGNVPHRCSRCRLDKENDESCFRKKDPSQANRDRNQEPEAHRFSFFFLNVQQHDHKNDQDHDGAGINDHLDRRDERRCQRHVQASQRNEDADQ